MAGLAPKVIQFPQSLQSKSVIEQAQTGDSLAFQELVEEYQGVVFGLIWKFVNDRATAEDLSQEVFLRAYKALPSFRGESSLKTWLCRIAVNRCRSYCKYKSHWHTWLPFEDLQVCFSAESTLEARAELRFLHSKICALRPKIREVAVLVLLEDYAYEDAAQVLGIPVGTVSSRMNKALKILREQLSKQNLIGDNNG